MSRVHLMAVTVVGLLMAGAAFWFLAGPAEKEARIAFENTIVELGNVPCNDTVEVEFAFTNAGKALLTIDEVESSSCACTSALPSGRQFLPGQSGSIKVRYRTGYNPGPALRRIIVKTNDPENGTVPLALHANVKRAVTWVPLRLDFGRVHQSDLPAQRRLAVYAPSGMDGFKVELVKAGLETFLQAEVKKAVPEVYRELPSYVVMLTLERPSVLGEVSAWVVLRTNAADQPEIKVPVKATVVGDWRASPGRVAFGPLKAGQVVDRTIRLVPTQGRKPHCTPAEVEVEGACFRAELHRLPDNQSYSVRVTASARDENSGNVYGQLRVHFDRPEEPLLPVALTALVVQ